MFTYASGLVMNPSERSYTNDSWFHVLPFGTVEKLSQESKDVPVSGGKRVFEGSRNSSLDVSVVKPLCERTIKGTPILMCTWL